MQQLFVKDQSLHHTENVAKALNVDTSKVCIKATTEEGLGFTGEGLGISSQAIALLEN